MIHAVIMAGGVGERFWPLSRSATPKQLLNIIGRETMIEQTVSRLKPMVDESRIWVVTTVAQAPAIRKLLPGIPVSHILREPIGRNTAPCIALAAYAIAREEPEAGMVVLPADHVISPKREFQRTIRAAARTAAELGSLITIGIKPTFPSTGYGYIKRGKKISETGGLTFSRVSRFVEKPDRKVARRFLKSDLYTWNSGMFIWSIPAIIKAIEEHLPELADALSPLLKVGIRRRQAFLDRVYPGLPKVSIDYGIMEKHSDVLVTAAAFNWDDVGSWEALEKYLNKDDDNNYARGELVGVDSDNCISFSTGPLVGLVGVSDLIVVASGDAVLVCPRDKAQDVKKLVQKLKAKKKYQELV
ncbi:MAG TPA: mannose-1-phosphate guanylyltransferase [Proteobacteria bacterium]|nr:mannose-1-phosphate guanylyltransferase [Pseudomonadota bacterium]